MAHYKVLLFDADGTLYDFQRSSREAFQKTMEQLEVPYSPELHRRFLEIDQSLWQQLEQKKITKQDIFRQRYQLLFAEQNLRRDAEQANQTYLELLSAHPHLIAGAQSLLEHIRTKHRVAIVTNGSKKVQTERIQKSPIGRYIDKVFISEEVGYHKPDTRFFDHVFSHMVPINRRRTLVIGDSLTADIKGGLDSGVHTCWYNPMRAENHTSIKPTYEIHSLEELLDII